MALLSTYWHCNNCILTPTLHCLHTRGQCGPEQVCEAGQHSYAAAEYKLEYSVQFLLVRIIILAMVNPWRVCTAGVMVLGLCVCVCVCLSVRLSVGTYFHATCSRAQEYIPAGSVPHWLGFLGSNFHETAWFKGVAWEKEC